MIRITNNQERSLVTNPDFQSSFFDFRYLFEQVSQHVSLNMSFLLHFVKFQNKIHKVSMKFGLVNNQVSVKLCLRKTIVSMENISAARSSKCGISQVHSKGRGTYSHISIHISGRPLHGNSRKIIHRTKGLLIFFRPY